MTDTRCKRRLGAGELLTKACPDCGHLMQHHPLPRAHNHSACMHCSLDALMAEPQGITQIHARPLSEKVIQELLASMSQEPVEPAAEPAFDPRSDDWRDMDTAPRDGTPVALLVAGVRYTAAWVAYSDTWYCGGIRTHVPQEAAQGWLPLPTVDTPTTKGNT